MGHVHSARMPKTKRWGLRVASETDQVVRHAATTANATLTDFVVDAAVTEAERVLPGRTQFALDPVEWARFADSLDRPHTTSRRSRGSSPSRASSASSSAWSTERHG